MSPKHKIVVFANVVFEQYGNQSVRNFVEGLLLNNSKVVFLTIHPQETEYMQQFMVRYPNFTVVYLLGSQKITEAALPLHRRLIRVFKNFVKSFFAYRRYPSNSEALQWLSLWNTYTVLRSIVAFIRNNTEVLENCDKYIFVDVFGGLIAKYLRFAYPQFWEAIAHKTVGYYLGTVLKQFRNRKILAFLIMPLSFWGSYKVPHERLIITDDGTEGEKIFREVMSYKNPILFVRNGMDERLAAYQGSSKIQGQNELRFVTCSRLTRWKRIDRAIRFVYFVKVITGRHFHLTIVGEGEERESLENLVHSLNLDNNTTFAGALLYNDALENIAKNDYYIVFNDLSNMGNQICESIMLGLIPLTIDDGSTDSLLRNGYNSIKFPMCTDFERNAARIFVSGLDDSNLRLLKQNLCETKNHVFTWRERNRLEYYFMFGNVQGETGTH